MFTSLLSLLGTLPASNSEGGKTNSLDWKKLARMALVMGASYVIVAVLEKITLDLGSGGFWFIDSGLQAPLMGVVALVLEWTRRKFAKPV